MYKIRSIQKLFFETFNNSSYVVSSLKLIYVYELKYSCNMMIKHKWNVWLLSRNKEKKIIKWSKKSQGHERFIRSLTHTVHDTF